MKINLNTSPPKDPNTYLLRRLKDSRLGLSQRIRLVAIFIPKLEATTCVRALKMLLEGALECRPSNEELYELCEASERAEVLHEYLRGFFLQGENDPRQLEMAQRLEGIVSYRMTKNEAKKHDRKLRQTLTDFLLRARN